MRKIKLLFIAIFLLALTIIILPSAYAIELPKWFRFNKKDALGEWQEKIFKNRVIYTVKPNQDLGYVLAKSDHACSGIVYRISFRPKNYPIISWQWKVAQFPKKNSAKNIKNGWFEQDDYAARVYVIFPSIIFTNIKAIEYIWDETLPEGKILSSPYLPNIKLIIIRSGKQNPGQWIAEKRNIYEDFIRAFGETPGKVGAIALMTDSDNTLSTAEAFYKDIKVGCKNE